MTVTNVDKDVERLMLTFTAEFDAPVERVWQLWEDPRQLERWWGPPGYPATFDRYEFGAGGVAAYFMTGPEGERYPGWWRIVEVASPRRLRFEDGFSDDEGAPNPAMPTTTTDVELADRAGGGTTMTITARFASLAAMEQLMAMGMDEGMTLALGQMDALLAG